VSLPYFARFGMPGRALLVAAALMAATFVIASGGSAARGQSGVAASTDISGVKYRDLRGSTGRVSVVVRVAGAPVAAVQAAAPGRRLSGARARALAAEIDRRQAPALQALDRLGGKLIERYRVVYNGFAVTIRRDRLDELARLPGVVGISPVRVIEPDHQNSMPFMKVPPTWGPAATPTAGYRGEGKRVAVIDSGLDYTHANFGGPGERAYFDTVDARDTLPPLLADYDPNKYLGGWDFVGDNYDTSPEAGETDVPAPDPNPLDCRENGHGSHVAGSVAGYGVIPNVLDIGFLTTYPGPWNDSLTRAELLADFKIGPGVAPLAGLYSMRVFGCNGSTTDAIVAAAIERALDPNQDGSTVDKVDVINMSLGSPFGGTQEVAAIASDNAVRIGTNVVTSAGNSGPNPYIVGSPSVASGTISVAANDPIPDFPSATATLTKVDTTAGGSIAMINANNEPIPSGTLKIVVARTATGAVSLGCAQTDYPLSPPGQLDVVVTLRGTCARVSRALRAEKAGYEAAIMINTAGSFPPFEGKITSDPDTGELPLNGSRVLIPFLGTRGCLATACAGDTADPETLVAADGGTMTLAAGVIVNPAYKTFATFSSGGPRPNDSWLKPDVTGPGVSILSTDAGMGNQATSAGGAIVSGTSMSSPHIAGLAALVRQARPTFTPEQVKAAIANTALPSEVANYAVRRGGTGFAQADRATATTVTAHGDELTSTLNFAFNEVTSSSFTASKTITLQNHGAAAVTFSVAEEAGAKSGVPHAVVFDRSSVTVPAGGMATVRVTLLMAADTAGNSAAFRDAGGLVLLTPAAGGNAGIALRVPYYMVPRTLSNINTTLANPITPSTPSTTATVSNAGGVMTGTGDFFAWSISDANEGLASVGRADIRAIGVQSFPEPLAGGSADGRGVWFAVNGWNRWSSASINEFDLYVDVNNDGAEDYRIVAADAGALLAGAFDGTYAALVFNERCLDDPAATCFDLGGFFATSPSDSSTLILRTHSDLFCDPDGSFSNPAGTPRPAHAAPCMSSAENPRFTYRAIGEDLFQFPDVAPPPDSTESAKFNVWSSAITQGPCVGCTPSATEGRAPTSRFNPGLAPGASGAVNVAVNAAEWAQSPQRGLMVVSFDNRAGADEAQLLGVNFATPPVTPPAQPPPPVVPPPPVTTPPPPPVRRAPRALRCVVPRTRGMTLPRARRAITRNRCRVGRISRAYSRALAKGRVMGQSPRAGARRRVGTRVALVVSRGKPPVRRPPVRPPFTG
jgi:minor extracellular serine protease Vpr